LNKPVEITDAAQAELDDAIDWYLREEPRAVAGFTQEYAEAIIAVGKYASSFAVYLNGTKRQLFASYPYQLVIRELPDRIQVVAVAHLKRKPGYWKRRLR
jgi:plasmid stabilization system protein ParE